MPPATLQWEDGADASECALGRRGRAPHRAGRAAIHTFMNEEASHYEVLGVPRDADPRTLQRAHRLLVKKYHPDRCRTPSGAETFARIQRAWETLRDPNERAEYDRTLPAPRHNRPVDPPAPPPQRPPAPAPEGRIRTFVQANPRRRGSGIDWETRLMILIGVLMAVAVLSFLLIPDSRRGAPPSRAPDPAIPAAPPPPAPRELALSLRLRAEMLWQARRREARKYGRTMQSESEAIQNLFALGADAFGRGDFDRAGMHYRKILARCSRVDGAATRAVFPLDEQDPLSTRRGTPHPWHRAAVGTESMRQE